MSISYRVRRRVIFGGGALVLVLLAACGDAGGPNEGPETATLSGTVREAGSAAALADVKVSIGAREATSDAGGQFQLTDVPIGAATVKAVRQGYTPAEASVTISAGANSHNFSLTPMEIYEFETYAIYVPAGVGPLRGAIIVLGGPVSSGFVTGDRLTPTTSSPDLETSLQSMGAGLRALARSKRLALLGTGTTGMADNSTSDQALFGALTTAAQLSGHAELADVPVVMFGLSAGGPEAAGLVARNATRSIGLLARVPTSVSNLSAPAALAVPTFVMQAELDAVVNNAGVESRFGGNRAQGGLWALAVEPDVGHSVATSTANSAALSWIANVLDLRLPATDGDPLLAIDETSGWLGNQSTLEIAPWAQYPGDRSSASWLLSAPAAASWKQLGSPGGS